MNKKTAIIIAAIIVVLAGVGTAIAIAVNNQNNQQSNQSDNSNKEADNNADPSKTFSPKDPNSLSYVATSTTTVAGQTVTSTTESDGKGTLKTSSNVAGMVTESYIKGNEIITCVNGECTKTTAEANPEVSNSVVNTAEKYRDSTKNAGTETVDGKTYQVWKATGDAGEVSYYLDSENRIGRVVLSSGTTVVYEYKDVTITVPQV